jgi:hypothetical protein
MEIRLLGNQLPWPDVFNVTILDLAGDTYAYKVLTWFGDPKAVALAVRHHESRFPNRDERGRIYDVRVERIGPAPSDDQGAVSGEDVDVLDRMEF